MGLSALAALGVFAIVPNIASAQIPLTRGPGFAECGVITADGTYYGFNSCLAPYIPGVVPPDPNNGYFDGSAETYMNFLATHPDPTTTVSMVGGDGPAGPVGSICVNGGDIYPDATYESACPGNSVDVTTTFDPVEPVASPLPTTLDTGGAGGGVDGDIQLYEEN